MTSPESSDASATNPFESPRHEGERQVNAGQGRHDPRYEMLGRLIVRWEKLRLIYNGILLVEVMLLTRGLLGLVSTAPELLLNLVGACAAANLCYFAGPAVDGYLSWFGLRSEIITWLLFVAGTLISVWLTLAVTFGITMSVF